MREHINAVSDLMNDEERIKHIRYWCGEMGIKKMKINDDWTIDVFDDFIEFGRFDFLPLQFNIVHGNFSVSDCGLKSLYGCPKIVEGNFVCSRNQITSLQYGPEQTDRYDCSRNDISSLEFSPRNVYGDFNCSETKILNFEGSPGHIEGNMFCDDLPNIESYKGVPKQIDGILYNRRSNHVLPWETRYILMSKMEGFDCSQMVINIFYQDYFVMNEHDRKREIPKILNRLKRWSGEQ